MKPFTRSLNPEKNSIWAVIPAAGVGRRMQADMPKQYLTLHGRSILAHTIDSLHTVPAIVGIMLVGELSQWPDDVSDALNGKPWMTTPGGAERCLSLAAQKAANENQQESNQALHAEVLDLKQGKAAIEERAREELGMIRDDETFYQIIEP